jgi:thioredoxin reductase
VPGDDLVMVQYTLDDPGAYKNERIVVIGAGDAAIENAIALSKKNKVSIVNRKGEFARAKQGNLDMILADINSGKITCYYNATSTQITEQPSGMLELKTADGLVQVPCERIIARLGAIPPRKFVESCGVDFPNDDPTSLPELSERYESNLPGLYIVGALGGYPLIKQALNQGYEVVEYILGNSILPAERLSVLPYQLDVEQCLKLFRSRIPIDTIFLSH